MVDRESVKADARRCWDSANSSALRAEFGGSFERYESYRLAAAAGSIRMHGSEVHADGSVTPRATVIA